MYKVPAGFKSGFITLIGRPNVGKSTLLNAYLGQKIAAVSKRPQTTRRRQLGILTLEEAQIIFMDTPGIHKPGHRLGDFMNQEAIDTLGDADVILWIVDASTAPHEDDELCTANMSAVKSLPPVIIALNKVDLISDDLFANRTVEYQSLLPGAEICAVSAKTGQGQDMLLRAVIDRLPQGHPYYDEEQVTDFYERDIAAELIREALLLNLREEVPHSIAIRIDEYKDRNETGAFISATIFVEKTSQKGIVIGRSGSMLKKIGMKARQEIETMSGRKIFLDLRVKVKKNWRYSEDALRLMGYYRNTE